MTKGKKLIGLDLLKAAAATLIVFHHYQQIFEIRYNGINFFGGLFEFGYVVELFFIISGFLMLYSEKAKNSAVRELGRKLLRIFPVAALACAFTLTIKSISAEDIGALWNWKTLIANFMLIFSGWPYFSMMGINNPTWYLCILIQCYLLFYGIRWLNGKQQIKRIWLELAVMVGVFVMRRLDFVSESTYRGIGAFSVGLLLFDLKKRIPERKLLAAITIAAGMIFGMIFLSQQRRALTFIAWPALVMLVVWWKGIGIDKIEQVISLCGKVSFEVFIWHYPLMALEQMITRATGFVFCHNWLTMVVFTSVAWGIAYVVYRYVEKPINHYVGRKIV